MTTSFVAITGKMRWVYVRYEMVIITCSDGHSYREGRKWYPIEVNILMNFSVFSAKCWKC